MLGSHPTRRAATVLPPASVTVSSPSSGKAWSAVTMSPGRQTKPLERERREWTETRPGAAWATSLASTADTSCIWANGCGFGHGASGWSRPSICKRLGAPPTAQVGRRPDRERAQNAPSSTSRGDIQWLLGDLAKNGFRGTIVVQRRPGYRGLRFPGVFALSRHRGWPGAECASAALGVRGKFAPPTSTKRQGT